MSLNFDGFVNALNYEREGLAGLGGKVACDGMSRNSPRASAVALCPRNSG
jgi:hypothetical protein